MLGPFQIKRLLKHCENVNKEFKALDMAGDEGPPYFDFIRNKGWCEALRLVLEVNGPGQIKNTPLEKE